MAVRDYGRDGFERRPLTGQFYPRGVPQPKALRREADRYLRQRGIAMRRFGSAYQDHLRITIGRRAELEKVAETFRSFLESKQP